ncbi:hypothetical protein FOL47_010060 [Perkinsus chesapeaki]|uniref:Sfi1 spindle body domain-containing protein n=1 Tax=Perkinsus chesapeaki TaxID=330153 RepID=A0A7J6MS62_PERCH|nr:hypothetical protein FOL47_010060 [Perkinsus chesapeaki]
MTASLSDSSSNNLSKIVLEETLVRVGSENRSDLQQLLNAFHEVLAQRGLGKVDKVAMATYRALLANHREATRALRKNRKPFEFTRRKQPATVIRSPPLSTAPHFGIDAASVSVMDSIVHEPKPWYDEEMAVAQAVAPVTPTPPTRAVTPCGSSPDSLDEVEAMTVGLQGGSALMMHGGMEGQSLASRSPLRRKFDAGKLFTLSIRCVSRRALRRWREGAVASRKNREGLTEVRKFWALRRFRTAVLYSKLGKLEEKMVSKTTRKVIVFWKSYTCHRREARIRADELRPAVERLCEAVVRNRTAKGFRGWQREMEFRLQGEARIAVMLVNRTRRLLVKWRRAVEDRKKLEGLRRVFRMRRGVRALRRFLQSSRDELIRAVEVEHSIMKHAWKIWARYHTWRSGLREFYSALDPVVDKIRQMTVVRGRRLAFVRWRRARDARRAYGGVKAARVRRAVQGSLRAWAAQLMVRLQFQRECVLHLQRWRLALAISKLSYNRQVGLYKASGMNYFVERGRLRVMAAVCDAWLAEVRYRVQCARVEVCLQQSILGRRVQCSWQRWKYHYSESILERARNEMALLQRKRRFLSRIMTHWLTRAVDGRSLRDGLLLISHKAKAGHFSAWRALGTVVRSSRLRTLAAVFGRWFRESARLRYSTIVASQKASEKRSELARRALSGLRRIGEQRKSWRLMGLKVRRLAERRRVRLTFVEWISSAMLSVSAKRLEARLPRFRLSEAFRRLKAFVRSTEQRDAERIALAVLWYIRGRLSAWQRRARWQRVKKQVVQGWRLRTVSLVFGVLNCWRAYSQRNREAAALLGLSTSVRRCMSAMRGWQIALRSKLLVDRLFICHVRQLLLVSFRGWRARAKSSREICRHLRHLHQTRSTHQLGHAMVVWKLTAMSGRSVQRLGRLSLDAWRMAVVWRAALCRRAAAVKRVFERRVLSMWIRSFRHSLALRIRCDQYILYRAHPIRSNIIHAWFETAKMLKRIGEVEAIITAAVEYTRMEAALEHWAVQTARAQVMSEVWSVMVPGVLLRWRAREALALWKARAKSDKSVMSRVVVAWRYELPRVLMVDRSSKSMALRHNTHRLLRYGMKALSDEVVEGRYLRRIQAVLALKSFRRQTRRSRAHRLAYEGAIQQGRLMKLRSAFHGWWRYRAEISQKLSRYPACCGPGLSRDDMLKAYYHRVLLRRRVLKAWNRVCGERARRCAAGRADDEMVKLLEIDRLLRPAFQAIRRIAARRKFFMAWRARAERSATGRSVRRKKEVASLREVWAVWAKVLDRIEVQQSADVLVMQRFFHAWRVKVSEDRINKMTASLRCWWSE